MDEHLIKNALKYHTFETDSKILNNILTKVHNKISEANILRKAILNVKHISSVFSQKDERTQKNLINLIKVALIEASDFQRQVNTISKNIKFQNNPNDFIKEFLSQNFPSLYELVIETK